jgi:serine/threonine protein phosphatase 1
MRILAIGDMHGCSRALDVLLEAIAPQPEDTLITLGDYVDRGPDSKGVIDRLLGLRDYLTLVPLQGNHEEMMLAARHGADRRMWLYCGGRETMASYGGRDGSDADFDRIPEAHWQFLDQLLDFHETEHHFFVHANVHADMDLAEQPGYMLRWERLDETVRHCSGKTMVCGHTKQHAGVPLYLGTAICIDTGVYDSAGWLTCLDVGSYRVWQANQAGELRTGWLEEYEEEDGSV